MTNGNGHLEPTTERDYCTRSGAEALAGTVRQFWAAFGHPEVVGWVEQPRGAQVWVVRSSLQAGLPPGLLQSRAI